MCYTSIVLIFENGMSRQNESVKEVGKIQIFFDFIYLCMIDKQAIQFTFTFFETKTSQILFTLSRAAKQCKMIIIFFFEMCFLCVKSELLND